jgi:4-hydroxy-4-methyl-2-oxoglutarate aldolase
MSDGLQQRLSRVDSCAVSDAMDRHGGPSGVALGIRAVSDLRRIAGRAVTVQLGPADGQPAPRHLCTAAVESAGPGQIIVVGHNGREDVAGWGGVLSLAARLREVEGVVIDGACRDIDEIREMGLVVYARGAVPVTARSRIIELAWNIPIQICGIAVCPGDWVIADGSGVVVIPANDAAVIIESAGRIVEKEQRMAADLRAGKRVSQVMGTDYERMLLGERIG